MLPPAPSGEARTPQPAPAHGGAAWLALALAMSLAAGMTDAIGFLSFGGVFVSFMSGDTTRLGVSLAQGAWTPAVLFLSVVVLFVGGAACGRALAVAAGGRRGPALLALTAVLLLMAAAAGLLAMDAAALILTVPAMGVMSAAHAEVDGVAVSPTYVTGALVRLGSALADWALGRGGGAVAVLAPMWAALLAGGVVGAFAFGRWALAALALPALLVLILAVLAGAVPALRPSRSEP